MTFEATPGTVYFVGAGPGAVDLITVRGRTLIESADLILFADSLVDAAHADLAKPGARVLGSSGLALDELTSLMVEAARRGEVVARLQSGDPTVYGAMHEQLMALRAAGVPTVVVPGVNSAFASAAALGIELTVPGLAQTVILTRASGRASAVPERESLRALASHGATLALFLSASLIEAAVSELIGGGYAPDTPAAIAYRVSWDDERLIRCTLEDVPARMRSESISRSSLVLVGPAIGAAEGAPDARSHLYDAAYTHRYRTAQVRTASVSEPDPPSPDPPESPPPC
jgi:precorrin-4/cobalt-precorrin-4 C11-methyltransferase